MIFSVGTLLSKTGSASSSPLPPPLPSPFFEPKQYFPFPPSNSSTCVGGDLAVARYDYGSCTFALCTWGLDY